MLKMFTFPLTRYLNLTASRKYTLHRLFVNFDHKMYIFCQKTHIKLFL